MAGYGTRRSFLFLQGLSTPFFVRLGAAIAARGHTVQRINFSFGDRLFWPRRGAESYRGKFADWRAFLEGYLEARSITDIVLFGDCRPYHRVARDLARAAGIRVHVFEEGYFRPDWITLERDGTNAHSRLPRDPAAIIREAARLAPRSGEGRSDGRSGEQRHGAEEAGHRRVGGGFGRRVAWELLNQFAVLVASPLFPHYRRHRSCHPVRELGGWARRVLVRRPVERRYARRVSDYLKECGRDYYLLPLQLESDYQIRAHSPFRSMDGVMETVLSSFAASAPDGSLMVIKLHPLDNGLVDVRRRAARLAAKLKLGGRVLVIDGGHLPTLLGGARGVVVVNSTAGLSALHHGRPLKVLGRALFDVAGLTFQAPLDRFWQEGTPPNVELFRAFRRVVLRRAQLNGSFFTRAGIELAVQGALDRMAVAAIAAYPATTETLQPSARPAGDPAPQPSPYPAAPARPALAMIREVGRDIARESGIREIGRDLGRDIGRETAATLQAATRDIARRDAAGKPGLLIPH